MTLDAPTMALMVLIMQVSCGGILIYASFHYRDEPTALWWGTSQIVLGLGVALSIAGGISSIDAITAAAFVVFVACSAIQWHGTRLLTGHRTDLRLVAAGPVLVALVNLVPAGDMLPVLRGIVASLLNVSYFTGSAFALIRPKSARLAAFMPLFVLFIANIVVLALGPFAGLGSTEGGLPPLLSLGGLIYLEGQFFAIGTTIFVVAGVRERREQVEHQAAATDPLTGLPNRRSFFEMGDALATRCQQEGAPLGAILIDLDRFKSINDRFGHATGDQMLQLFAQVARKSLRTNDVIGRLGGEEFGVLLCGSGLEATIALAERLRKSFEFAAEFYDGAPVGGTLCAGVASSTTGISLGMLLKDADAAMYQAKAKGRNRVEYLSDAQPPTPSRIARVA